MDQVELMEKMNSLLQRQLETLVAIEEKMKGQGGTWQQANQAANDYADANDRVAAASNAAAEAGNKAATSMGSFTDSIKSFVGDEAYDRFTNGLNDGLSLLKINFGTLAQIVSNPVSAAFGFLGELYDKIISKAAELAKESQQLTIAMERVREKFGSFNENTSRRVRSAFNTFGETLKTTGENARQFGRKFEPGVQGSIQKLEKMMEIMEDIGPMIDVMGQQFNDAKDNLYLLKDGLGFTAEGLKQTALMANLSGKSLRTMSAEILASVNKIGKQFNISTKALGADVGKALSNFKMLGRMTGDYVKEITKAAVFTRKLGFELNELTGLVDKFDEFEGGAEAAAQLAQGFGLVIDPLKMMGMEAAPRLQELQRAFTATGRSIDSMSRQERKLLADTAGLTEEQAMLAFSAKGLTMSYDQISAGAEAATKKQKTTEEIMNDVLDNIKNIIVEFKEFTGFITAFFEGFGRGFMGEGSVMSLIKKLAGQLMQVAHIGEQVGRMFAKVIFGGNDTKANGQAVLQIFSKVGDMFVQISEHIKTFVAAMEGGDIAGAAKKLFSNVFGSIEGMFTGASGGINIGGIVTKIGKFMLDMVRGAIRFLIEKLPEYTRQLKGLFSENGEESMLGTMINGIGEALQQLMNELPALLPVLADFANELIEAIPKFFEKYKIATLFVAGGPLAVFASGFMGGLFEMMSGYFSGGKFTDDMMKKAHGAVDNAATAATAAAAGDVAAAAAGGAAVPEKSFLERAMGRVGGAYDGLLNLGKGVAAAGAVGTAVALAPLAFTTLAEGIRNAILVFTRKLTTADGIPAEYNGKSTIEILAAQVKLFNGIDPAAISAVGGMIAGIITSSTGILGLSIADMKTLTPEDIEKIQRSIASTLTIYQGVVEIVTSPMVGKSLSKAARFGENIKKMKLVGDSMAGLSDTLRSVISSIPKKEELADFGTKDDTLETKLRSAVGLVISLFQDTMQGPGILTQLASLNIPAGLTADKIKAITSVSDAARQMGDSAKSLADVGKGGYKTDDITKALTLIMTIGENLPPVFETFNNLIAPAQMAIQEGKMKGALNVLNSYLNGMSEITPTKLAAAGAVNFNDIAFDPLRTSGPGSLSEIMQTVSAAGLFPEAEAFDANTASIDKFMNLIDRYMDGMTYVSSKLSATRMAQVEQRVTALVAHTSTIRGILENLKSIPLDATIDALEKDMSVAKTTMSIAGGAVNISVNLNVTMNAEKMAAGLVLGGYVEGSTEFKDYMKTGYKDASNTDKIFNGTTPPDFGGYEGWSAKQGAS